MEIRLFVLIGLGGGVFHLAYDREPEPFAGIEHQGIPVELRDIEDQSALTVGSAVFDGSRKSFLRAVGAVGPVVFDCVLIRVCRIAAESDKRSVRCPAAFVLMGIGKPFAVSVSRSFGYSLRSFGGVAVSYSVIFESGGKNVVYVCYRGGVFCRRGVRYADLIEDVVAVIVLVGLCDVKVLYELVFRCAIRTDTAVMEDIVADSLVYGDVGAVVGLYRNGGLGVLSPE